MLIKDLSSPFQQSITHLPQGYLNQPNRVVDDAQHAEIDCGEGDASQLHNSFKLDHIPVTFDSTEYYRSDFSKITMKLQATIYSLSNSYSRELICKILETHLLNDQEDLKAYDLQPLLSLPLPQETKRSLEKLSLELSQIDLKDSKVNQASLSSFKKEIKELIQLNYIEDVSDWKSYEVFFNSTQILALSNSAINGIKKLIERGNTQTFTQDVLEVLELYLIDIDAWDRELQATSYKNVPTLLEQLIQQKPIKREDIATYWNKPETFFKSKTLYITDPQSLKTDSITIKSGQKTQQGDWIFKAEWGEDIRITPNYEVSVSIKRSYSLEFFLSDFLSPRSAGMLTIEQSSHQTSSVKITPQTYHFSKIHPSRLKSFIASIWSKISSSSYEDFELRDPKTHQLKYQFRVNFSHEEKTGTKVPLSIQISYGENPHEFEEGVALSELGGYDVVFTGTIQKITGITKDNVANYILVKDEIGLNRMEMAYID